VTGVERLVGERVEHASSEAVGVVTLASHNWWWRAQDYLLL